MIGLSIMRFLPCVEKLDIISVGFIDEILIHPKYHNNGVKEVCFKDNRICKKTSLQTNFYETKFTTIRGKDLIDDNVIVSLY